MAQIGVEYVERLFEQRFRKVHFDILNKIASEFSNVCCRMNEPITKWWFYIYNIVEQFLIDKTIGVQELIVSLQKFITQSNLAEFENRVNLLYTFHCHVTYLEPSKEKGTRIHPSLLLNFILVILLDILISVLWNLHQYFLQFSPNVLGKIKELRTPIEKKLKDYIKIVRWKDISYWAIKETLHKTHKTLHKYMREFQNDLGQPASACLVNCSSKDMTNVGIWDRPQRHIPKDYHYTMDSSFYLVKQAFLKVMFSS